MTTPKSDDSPNTPQDAASNAVELIRQKIDAIHTQEPSAKDELTEVKGVHTHLSKHQHFMQSLSTSGKSLAEIQTTWHNYYVGLPDSEKHQVWQEFYQQQGGKAPSQTASAAPAPQPISHSQSLQGNRSRHATKLKTVGQMRQQLTSSASASVKKKLNHRQHVQSILFGLGCGAIVIVLFLFSFFNDRFIAPFITPSRQVSSTPIIAGDTTASDSTPKVIIPKINVEIPVVYDEPSVDEKAVENALERGVVHYATTSNPGETGNTVLFGHSSNNILNKGKYKFAFVLLSRLEVGDTFYLTRNGTRYAYRVYEKKIVKPTEVDVLNAHADKPAIATLITCDPPGTSLNRLIVVGEQISPSPDKNVASTAVQSSLQPTIIPSNAPSLWSRLTSWL